MARRHGGGLLLIGVWLLLSELHIWRASESWPLFLVAFGIRIVWNAVHGRPRDGWSRLMSDDYATDMSMRRYRQRQPAVQVVLGLVIATLGVLFTLDNLHILRARDFLQFWPIVFVAIGLAQIAQARTSARVVVGLDLDRDRRR